jgi:hypothetical protein
MSKEKDLIESMRNSLSGAPDALPGIPVSGKATNIDLGNGMEIITNIVSSMVNDPIFYVKILGLLVITVVIVMVSFEMIASGA